MTLPSPPLVWFITGTSQGFGRELVRAALGRGDRVVATSRTPEAVAKAFPEASSDGRLLAIGLDLGDPWSVSSGIETAAQRFGRIDVLVNNAGHGLLGAVEEASDEEIRAVYETNVFGLVRLIRAALPLMREKRSGHIVNLSSIGGLVGLPGWGHYNATKFAVEGLSEALAAELAPLGIGVTVVEPSGFRTDFLGTSLRTAGRRIDDYDASAGRTRGSIPGRHGNQAGDPAKAADAIVAAVTGPKPPLHLVLGGFAVERAIEKIDALRADIEAWREVALAADAPQS